MSKSKQNGWESLINISFNIIIPMLIMTKLNGSDYLGPIWSLVVALLFPLCYGIWERFREKKTNIFSIVGLVSILLTGGIGLLNIPAQRVAVKEAGVPLLLGLGVLVALWRGYPVAKVFVLHALDQEKIHSILRTDTEKKKLERLEKLISYVFAGSFFLSAILNYVLAKWIVTAPAGTEEFTAQLGRMIGLSFPVIAIPTMIVLMIGIGYLLWKVSKLTGLLLEDLVKV